MEYTEMIDKVKALAAQNRVAKTEEEKDEVRRQMNILKSIDPKAFAVAVGYMAKNTEQKVKGTDYVREAGRDYRHGFHGLHRQGLLWKNRALG